MARGNNYLTQQYFVSNPTVRLRSAITCPADWNIWWMPLRGAAFDFLPSHCPKWCAYQHLQKPLVESTQRLCNNPLTITVVYVDTVCNGSIRGRIYRLTTAKWQQGLARKSFDWDLLIKAKNMCGFPATGGGGRPQGRGDNGANGPYAGRMNVAILTCTHLSSLLESFMAHRSTSFPSWILFGAVSGREKWKGETPGRGPQRMDVIFVAGIYMCLCCLLEGNHYWQ